MLIHRDVFESVLPATTTEDTRYYLAHVHVRPDGTVEATDGHIALIAKAAESATPDADFPSQGIPELTEIPAPILVDAAIVRSLISATPKREQLPVLSQIKIGQNGAGAVLCATDLQAPRIAQLEAEASDARRFPTLDRVRVPADRPAIKIRFGVEVLEHLCKAAKAAYKQSGHAEATILFSIPTEAQYQGKVSGEITEADPNPGWVPNGYVEAGVRIDIRSTYVAIEGVALPFREA